MVMLGIQLVNFVPAYVAEVLTGTSHYDGFVEARGDTFYSENHYTVQLYALALVISVGHYNLF